MSTVAPIRRNLKNVIKNYSEAQVKVREATSNDPWGPSSSLMTEIADYTYNVVAFSEIMQMIWKRLNDNGKNWRHVYKALSLLEYIIKTGNEKVAQQCKENIFTIQTLKDFQYIEDNKDQGLNVREKAKQIVALLKDDERLKNERTRALKAKERFAQSSSIVFKDPEHLQQNKDWESARPSNIGEEELQLRLALAMSKEEADKDKKIIQGDDLRLKIALSQSEQEKKDDSGILSDGNPLIDINPEDSFNPWQDKSVSNQTAIKSEPISLDHIFSMQDERFQDNGQATSSYPFSYNIQSSNFTESQTNAQPISYFARPTVPYNSNQLPNINYSNNQMPAMNIPIVTHSQSLFNMPHSTSFQSNNPFL